jgi:predicted negative regulator of RcsB-dependent stress response
VVQASAGRSDAWDKDADEIVNTFQNGGYDKALAMLDARKQTKAEPKGLTMVRGWTLYHRGDWTGARKVFTDAASAGQSTEAQSALRVLDTSETPQRFR